MARLVWQGFINGANQTQAFFINGQRTDQVRTYTAVPIYGSYVPFDQQCEIEEVFNLRFGSQHNPADVNNLQANIVVLNKVGGVWGAGGAYCYFQVYESDS